MPRHPRGPRLDKFNFSPFLSFGTSSWLFKDKNLNMNPHISLGQSALFDHQAMLAVSGRKELPVSILIEHTHTHFSLSYFGAFAVKKFHKKRKGRNLHNLISYWFWKAHNVKIDFNFHSLESCRIFFFFFLLLFVLLFVQTFYSQQSLSRAKVFIILFASCCYSALSLSLTCHGIYGDFTMNHF